jgi:hypothetical protein
MIQLLLACERESFLNKRPSEIALDIPADRLILA